MLRRLIIIGLILLASIWAGTELAKHPSFVLFNVGQWVIEMPLWLVLLATLFMFFVFYFCLRFLTHLRRFDDHVRGWLSKRRSKRSSDKTHRGLLALKEENWAKAERHLLSAVEQAKNPVIPYLSAAEAAYAQKAYERSEAYLQKAYQVSPQDEVVIGLVQAKMQLEQGQLEQAQKILTRLRGRAPYHSSVLKLLERLYIQLSEWQQLIDLLPALCKAKVISDEKAELFEKNLYSELLAEAERKNQSIHAVRSLWRSMPKKIRLHPDILERYARLLKDDRSSAEELEPLIRKILHKEWQPELAKIYGSLVTADPARQLAMAEEWSKQYGKRNPLLLTLGRLALRCQLWGKARYYLEEGLEQEVNSETQFELAKLFEQLGETQLALSHYKNGLSLAIAK